MGNLLRFDRRRQPDDRGRTAAGVYVDPRCRRILAASVHARGRGFETIADVVADAAAALPGAVTDRFNRLVSALSGKESASVSELLATINVDLAKATCDVLSEIQGKAPPGSGRFLVVAVEFPELRFRAAQRVRAIEPCDPAFLAEATGMNIVDAFTRRDIACGGHGGPLHAIPEWLLLRDRRFDRVMLYLGPTVHLTYLPHGRDATFANRILSFDAGPGVDMLDPLASRLTAGRERSDDGGRLAAQGCRLEPLLTHWLADPYFESPLPRWQPRGVSAERFLGDAFEMAIRRDWSIRDLLCTATHFIAEVSARAVYRHVPLKSGSDRPIQIVVAGEGRKNGMLLREISARLPEFSVRRIEDIGFPDKALRPASTAVLGLMHLDQTPANSPSVTGVDVARVLGRLTPGNPQNHQRLLVCLGGTTPAVRPLRGAVG
jgi:anhydro-N-acetylmuramic acid kinase